jgi:hypothetical protein
MFCYGSPGTFVSEDHVRDHVAIFFLLQAVFRMAIEDAEELKEHSFESLPESLQDLRGGAYPR